MALKARLAAAEKRLGGLPGHRPRQLRYRYIFADGAGQVMRTFDVPLSKKALAESMKDYAKDTIERLNIRVVSSRGEKDDAPTIGGDVDDVARLEAEVKALVRKRDRLRAKVKNARR